MEIDFFGCKTRRKVCSNGLDHVTKRPYAPIWLKKTVKIFSRTRRLVTLGLDMLSNGDVWPTKFV